MSKTAPGLLNKLSWGMAVGVGLLFWGKDKNSTINDILLICLACK